MLKIILSVLAFYFGSLSAFANQHAHEDLFNEQEIHLGAKIGPQLTQYSPVRLAGAPDSSTVEIQPAVEFLGGLTIKFVYSYFWMELDVFWNQRAWPNIDDNFFGISTPIYLKFPLELGAGVSVALGAGYQPDFLLYGPIGHRGVLSGFGGSFTASWDLQRWILELELRYNYVVTPLTDAFVGGRPRDFQVLMGPSWHF